MSKFLGGPDKSAKKEPKNLETAQAVAEADADGDGESGEEAVAQVRLTADHRACADFFALYMYTMYMRGEMNNMWQGLTWAYDHLGEGFEDLLARNKNLRPMVESVAAQLKRGALLGFDKAFGKKTEGAGGAPAEMKTGMGASKSQEMFKRPDPAPAVAAGGGMRTERSAPQLNIPVPSSPVAAIARSCPATSRRPWASRGVGTSRSRTTCSSAGRRSRARSPGATRTARTTARATATSTFRSTAGRAGPTAPSRQIGRASCRERV